MTRAGPSQFRERPATLLERYQNPDNDPRGPWISVAMTTPGKNRPGLVFEWHGHLPPEGQIWTVSAARMAELEARGLIVVSTTGRPRMKRYLTEITEDHPANTESPSGDGVGRKDIQPAHPLVALAVFGNTLKAVELRVDGSYSFLDDAQCAHDVIYVLSRERLALGEAVDELEALVNSPTALESDFQRFFERHPEFILTDDYKRAHGHVVLSRDNEGDLIPDFVLEPADGALSDLLELKLPGANVFTFQKNRNRFSAAVHAACAQLREYSRYFEEERHRNFVREKFGLQLYRPRMFLILGRRGDIDPIEMRAIQCDTPHLNLRTYDDVIARMRRRLDIAGNH